MEVLSYSSKSPHRIIKDEKAYKLQRQNQFLFWKKWKTIDSDTRVKDCWLHLHDMSKNYAPIISRP